jgi:ABC-2 type transport system ATP-binding protein
MESVEEICDKIVLINSSHNILQGRVKDIKQEFKRNEYEIITNHSFIEDSLIEGTTLVSKNVDKDDVTTSILKIEQGQNAPLLSNILTNMNIISYKEVLPSMNEIFIQTVKKNNNE